MVTVVYIQKSNLTASSREAHSSMPADDGGMRAVPQPAHRSALRESFGD